MPVTPSTLLEWWRSLTEGRLLPESEKLITHFQALYQSYE